MDSLNEFKHIVVDDFLPDPDSVRQSAINAGFGKWQPNKGLSGDDYYRGLAFYGNHAPCVKAIVKALGRPVYPNAMVFRATNLDTEPASIHTDVWSGDYACIIYLSKHEDGSSGTEFYKHKPTDTYHSPNAVDLYSDLEKLEKLKVESRERSPEVWEKIKLVEGKYNRAVIFPAAQWHSRYPINGIGNTEEEGRLIWVSQFYV